MNTLFRMFIYALYVISIAWGVLFLLSSTTMQKIFWNNSQSSSLFCSSKIPVSSLIKDFSSNGSQDAHLGFDNIDCVQSNVTKALPWFCIFPTKVDKFISANLLSDQIWDKPMTKVFLQVLQAYPSALVIDIGANIGYFTILSCSNQNYVLSVEPAAESLTILSKAVKINKCQNLVTVFQAALFDCHCSVVLSTSTDNQGGRRIAPPGCQNTAQRRLVQTLTLADLVPYAHAQQHVIVKIDIGK